MKSIKAQNILRLSLVISVVCISLAYSQQRKTGDFDISKVQQAVKTGMADSISDVETGSGESVTRRGASGDNYMLVTFRIIGYLVFLILVIVLVIWFIKRLGLSGTSKIGGGSMDLLEALPVGQNRSIMLVRVMDAVYVLAQTAQNVTLLEKIEGDRAVELIATTKGGTSIMQFKDVFNNFIGKIKKTS